VSEPPGAVAVDAVFERFPASVRGAVVVRGTDPDPHQIRLEQATVLDPRGRGVHEVAVEETVVDLAPRGEILVPFDIPFAGLDPGWYRIAADVLVDGQQRIRGPEEGKRFLVPWPGAEVRRGTVEAGVDLGGGASVRRLECRPDRATVRWHAPPDERGELRVLAEGDRLPEIGESVDESSGDRATVVYPILKEHRRLTFELHAAGRSGRPATMNLP
jgi:hypothetical protein